MPIIVGVPRSGTTLLRMMIDSHPAVAIPPETGFLPVLADLEPGEDARLDAWRLMTGADTWPDFHLDASALRAAFDRLAPPTPAAAARTFYRLYAERFGKHQWGDKTPTYGAELTRIASLLPEARFIHVIRDGRDVVLSVRGLWFSPGDTIESCALDWATRLARTRALGSQVPWYLEIRYEALVRFPEETLREVCRFLNLGFDPHMLSYYVRAADRLDEHEGRYASDGSEIISKRARLLNQRLVTAPPRSDRIGRWRTGMTGTELGCFESVAGEWLDRLGYQRGA